jgi:predicted short-subunit dehydrogenase-like oxidoreductase (DUF2520 family)
MTAYASAFKDPRPGVAIVGAGAVGHALALRLADRGYPVLAVISKTRSRAEALAQSVGAPVASNELFALPAAVRLVLICVDDDAVADVAESLTGVRHAWRETVVAHTSGALTSSVLSPLADEGADTLSFHPLQALTAESGPEALEGVYVGLEGGQRAVGAGIELAVGLGLRYLVLSPEAKARYHVAAVVASNFLVTLTAIVQEILQSIDVPRDDSYAMIEPLVRGTFENLARLTPEEALTGPVVRGDTDTLRRHGLSLRQHLPQLVPVYAAMTVEAVRVAVRSGRLDPRDADEVLALMQRLVTTPLPPRGRPDAPEPTPRVGLEGRVVGG